MTIFLRTTISGSHIDESD